MTKLIAAVETYHDTVVDQLENDQESDLYSDMDESDTHDNNNNNNTNNHWKKKVHQIWWELIPLGVKFNTILSLHQFWYHF
jgi:hypothetical protein